MFFKATTRYALCALASLPEDGTYRQAGALASDLGLPVPYLPKVLRALVRRGLLESVTGPEGGFRLARPAHRISVGEVVQALEGKVSGCVLGLPSCEGHRHPCAIFTAWQAVAETTIRDLNLLRRTPRGEGGA
jgi:Rrf2 family protein